MKSLGPGVRQARKRRRLTQKQIATSVQLSPQFYGRIERGRALPSVSALKRMCHELDTSADTLLGLHRDPEKKDEPTQIADTDTSLGLVDPLPIRRLMRRLRRAPPQTQHLITRLLDELAQHVTTQ